MIKSLIADVGPLNIDVLVMEGTHFGNTGRTKKSEYDLEFELAELTKSAPGLVLGAFSPIDVDRLVSYLKAAIRSDRTFVIDAYAAYVMHLVASEIGIPHPAEADGLRIYFNAAFRRRGIKQLQDLFSGNQIELSEILAKPKRYLMAFRPSMVDLDFDKELPAGSRCLYSYWKGYLDRDDWVRLQDHLRNIGGDFIPAHTSGHIFIEDLVRFVNSINPEVVVPIHTFEPDAYAEHFPNVRVLEDGEVFSIE
jgi:ribonuclease J